MCSGATCSGVVLMRASYDLHIVSAAHTVDRKAALNPAICNAHASIN